MAPRTAVEMANMQQQGMGTVVQMQQPGMGTVVQQPGVVMGQTPGVPLVQPVVVVQPVAVVQPVVVVQQQQPQPTPVLMSNP